MLVSWQSLLFLYDKRIPIFQSVFCSAFKIPGDFRPFFEPLVVADKF